MNNPKIFDTVQEAKQYALEVCKYSNTVVLGTKDGNSKWAVCGVCAPPTYCHSKEGDAAAVAIIVLENESESEYMNIPNETALIYKI